MAQPRANQSNQEISAGEGTFLLSRVDALKEHPANPRKHSRTQVRAIADSIRTFGFNGSIVIDGNNRVLAGHGRLEAARLLGLTVVPTICIPHLSDAQARAYMLADNKLTDRSSWDDNKLAIELKALLDIDLDLTEATGFEMAEIDLRIQSLELDDIDRADEFKAPESPPVAAIGDIWTLGRHRIYCGSALNAESYESVLGHLKCSAVFTDPPYNVRINGHVRGNGAVSHREFPMASGEMTASEFQTFLSESLALAAANTFEGSLIYACMDWRGLEPMMAAARTNALEQLNLCVWVKTNGGMGSFYRSRHELIFVFRHGKAPHTNNVQLGRFGRNRTNVWNYAGANSFARGKKSEAFDCHPTVKPIRLVEDALLDCTKRGDAVLDPFLGSGTTLLAAERTGRKCLGIELDPVHVETAIRRWEAMTGEIAKNQDSFSLSELKTGAKNERIL